MKFKLAKFKVPNTYAILFSLVVLVAGLTWVVPASSYDTHEVNGRQVVDPTTFE